MRFLIIGCGSMGKRRARCLRRMGHDVIAAYDPREDRRRAIVEESHVIPYESLEEALAATPDFALICVPPHLHYTCLEACIDARIPAFCEAPLTLTLAEADAVIEAAREVGVFIAPSCTYLHNALHRKVCAYVRDETFGRPLAALSYAGQHVEDWHPYEDYRQFYASKRSQGGMCFDMLPHELHLFTWLLGDVRVLQCMARRRNAAVETDPGACDAYDLLLDMQTNVTLTLHEDMFQRPWGCYRKIMFERGAVEWNWRMIRTCEYRGAQFLKEPEWRDATPQDYDFEAMYVSELEHALEASRGAAEYLMPLDKERHILELVLASEQSSTMGQEIRFNG